MPSNNKQSNQKKGWRSYFIKFSDNVKVFGRHEWTTFIFFSLLGFIGFLIGYSVQTEHVFIGRALMALEAITAAYHRFVFRQQIVGEIDAKFEILKKEVIQELHLFLAKSTEDLPETVAKRLQAPPIS